MRLTNLWKNRWNQTFIVLSPPAISAPNWMEWIGGNYKQQHLPLVCFSLTHLKILFKLTYAFRSSFRMQNFEMLKYKCSSSTRTGKAGACRSRSSKFHCGVRQTQWPVKLAADRISSDVNAPWSPLCSWRQDRPHLGLFSRRRVMARASKGRTW